MRTRPSILILGLLLLLAPVTAHAQAPVQTQGIIQASRTSVTVTNSAAGAILWKNTVPGGFASPLHLRLDGMISSDVGVQASPANVTCYYGGANASLTLLNATGGTNTSGAGFLLPSQTNVPFWIDVMVRPVPVWQAGTNVGEVMEGRMGYNATPVSAFAASATNIVEIASILNPANGGANGTQDMTLAAGNKFVCTWQWASATTGKSVTIWNGNLFLGY